MVSVGRVQVNSIDFSSFSSFSSSLLIGGIFGAERDGETIVTFDDWDGDCDAVGDGDRDGGLTVACLAFCVLVVNFGVSFLCLPFVGMFQ